MTEEGLERTLRVEGGRVLATLTRVLGDLQLAEDAVQDAIVAALERWPVDGTPTNPAAWLTVTARNRAYDRLRRESRRPQKEEEAVHLISWVPAPPDESVVGDDVLRLLFTCCHPALAPEARVALSLRTLGGMSTAEISRAFLVSESTMAQRIVRAKHKIATAHIPYRVPADDDLPERLGAVLAVVYVIFTEGHTASAGDAVVRVDLCDEAIRLARLLTELLPDEPEVTGLLALLLLTDARRATRTDGAGDLVLLEDQDRDQWDRRQIDEGAAVVDRALGMSVGHPGPYVLQAAIAACHATAPRFSQTDWHEIAVLYRRLESVHPAPIVRLNRAVAVAEVEGPAAGLAIVDTTTGLARYHRYHAVRADLLRRMTRDAEAADAYRAALELEPSAPERRYLERRLAELG